MKFDFSRNPENCAWMRRNDKNVKFYFQKNVYFTLFLNSGLTLESPETAAPVFSPRAVKSESSGDRPGQPHIVKNTSYLRCFSLQPSLSTGLGTNPYLSKSDFFLKIYCFSLAFYIIPPNIRTLQNCAMASSLYLNTWNCLILLRLNVSLKERLTSPSSCIQVT